MRAAAGVRVDQQGGLARARRRTEALRDTLGFTVGPRAGAPAEQATVTVIGGGFAGLSSALFLRAIGCRVTLYEASARLGGRVWSQPAVSAPERLVEWGAELVGFNHVLWVFLARVFGLGFAMETDESTWDRLNLTLPVDLLGQVQPDAGAVWDGMDAAFQTLNQATQLVPAPYSPWTAPNAATYDAQSLQHWKDSLHLDPVVAAAVEVDFACNNTRPTAQQSYLGVLAQVSGGGGEAFWTDSEVMRCATGNQSLAAAICASVQADGVVVSTGSRVVAVSWNGSQVTTRLASGASTTSDFVVLAVPQLMWQGITFSPALPQNLVVQTGPAVKFLSTLTGRPWLAGGLAPVGLSDRIGETWEGTDNQTMGPGQHAVLSVFAGAQQAQQAINQGSGVAAWYRGWLERLYPGYTASLVSPSSVSFLNWPAQPYIGCGYSCPAPGEVIGKVQSLSQPVAGFGNRLVFAGEHTSPCFFGYMEGALESGLHAAEMIGQVSGVLPSGQVDAALQAAAEAGRV